MDNWFTIDRVDDNTYIISEYRHWEETHCYLLNGSERSLLIDTGLGISNIYDEVIKFTNKPITAVATHIHWDHIGGHQYFPDFYAHAGELDWLNGKFPLSMETIRKMVIDRCDLPNNFNVYDYELFQGIPTKIVTDHDVIDIIRMRKAFEELKENGKLCHGSGTFNYGWRLGRLVIKIQFVKVNKSKDKFVFERSFEE